MSETTQQDGWHRRVIEHRSVLLAVLTTVTISIGGIAEIVPMYAVPSNSQVADGIAPYTPLEVAGRDIYLREGCFNCHSQMVRPMRAETLRYGPWTRAAESAWDRPFQLGSRRIGPDLQRVGGKYPDSWHYEHMRDPRATSPGSIMPTYAWLLDWRVDPADITASVQGLATLGHPYADTTLAGVTKAMNDQAAGIVTSLGSANIQVEPDREIVAMIAYLQRLGTDGRKLYAEAK